MPSIGQRNLETVVIDFFGALRRGDFDAASAFLDPSVTWQGVREDFVCQGREEVIDTFRGALDERRETDALEFIRGGDRVIMGARGPSLTEVGGEPLEGQIFNVFTLRDGRITRIEDYRQRAEALAAAGVVEQLRSRPDRDAEWADRGSREETPIRLASVADAPAFGRLLHAFNVEFGESTPSAEVIAARAAPLIESGEVTVLFAGEGPDGFAELRFRPSLYSRALDAYLEELYVVPERRGRGLGRALLEAAMRHARNRGAARIDLNTSEKDVAARTLYESAGFTNREGGPDGPTMLYYERDL